MPRPRSSPKKRSLPSVPKRRTAAARDSSRASRYSAPALEKGLEIIEIVSAAGNSIKTEEIARAAGRSRSEIYRMLQVLEAHGFIAREQNGEGYTATSKMFTLGMRKTPIADLNSAALPEMRRLSDQLAQSVGLVVPADDQIAYIARVESARSFSLTLPLGFHRRIVLSNSGRVLFAFQPPERQLEWLAQLRETAPGADIEGFVADANKARRNGWLIRPSVMVKGVTDICAPIWTANSIGCAANLIVPLIAIIGQDHDPDEVARMTRAAADRITQVLRPHIAPV